MSFVPITPVIAFKISLLIRRGITECHGFYLTVKDDSKKTTFVKFRNKCTCGSPPFDLINNYMLETLVRSTVNEAFLSQLEYL